MRSTRINRPSVGQKTTVRLLLALLLPALLFTLSQSTGQAQVTAGGLVAAYSFNEGSGVSVGDASGSGNVGSVGSAAWSAAGKFGGALSFSGSGARVTVPDAASLRLSSAMTLEAWVSPSAVSSAWRDVIVKGDDDYYLMATSAPSSFPVGAGIFGGVKARAFGTSVLALNAWTHLAVMYDGAVLRLYVNGVLVASTAKTGAIASSSNPLQFGGDAIYGQYFAGKIDEVRVYNVALSAAQVQTDMNTPVVASGPDPTPPTVAITSPANNAQVTDIVNVAADASDNVGVVGVQFLVDGTNVGAEDIDPPYGLAWDTRAVANGAHTLTARAWDAGGNSTVSTPVPVNVANSSSFQNEVLATGFNLPVAIEFLPDASMLVVEFGGTIKLVPPPYTRPTRHRSYK